MQIELLYFDGCPSYLRAEEALREVLTQEGSGAEVRRVAVETDEEAQRLSFPGSPTIRADGHDLFPQASGEHEDWRLGCRIYATPEGFKGAPTSEMFREALFGKFGKLEKEAGGADRDLQG